MVSYAYRCPRCGEFETRLPMGRATATLGCPDCGASAVRRFTAPALRRAATPVDHARERAERSAHEPEVVSAPPPKPVRVSRDPRHARLPRP
ncbi:putative regulatory protein, FmdB family [Saccharomonospora marina XMU15]|uniref:Putative regulatory protein, FmdB family n=1 Tax=Saccharomonospora marina XMU15 TaxID=882083 RepID=H5X4N2_9PSEU|nr:zinc ribbon domain-containing protein [Saccharomonospora marina]EHR51108.1 putative regulatory protein, FmdB family [Saccharomonospora marina XMU15]